MLGHSLLERYAQTTHRFNQPSGSVVITNPIHPLYGHSVVVRSIRQVGQSSRVLVEHPDGGLISLPTDETSLSVAHSSPQVEGQTPLFDPHKLLRLAQWAANRKTSATLSHPPTPKEISSGEHKEIVQRSNDVATDQTTPRQNRHHRRTAPAPDKTDSAVGQENARQRTLLTPECEEENG